MCSCIAARRWVLKMRTIIVLYEMWHASLTSNVHISWFAWDLLSTQVHANVQVYDVRHILTSACFVCFLYIGTCHPCISHPVFGTNTYLGFFHAFQAKQRFLILFLLFWTSWCYSMHGPCIFLLVLQPEDRHTIMETFLVKQGHAFVSFFWCTHV